MYKHILLPTDGSARSVRAVESGLELAKCLGARVTGLFVSEQTYISEVDENIAPRAELALIEITKRAKGLNVECECATILGETPQEGIMRVATEKACDLIVMGTHGRSRVGKFFLGSAAASVLADCEIPVLLFR